MASAALTAPNIFFFFFWCVLLIQLRGLRQHFGAFAESNSLAPEHQNGAVSLAPEKDRKLRRATGRACQTTPSTPTVRSTVLRTLNVIFTTTPTVPHALQTFIQLQDSHPRPPLPGLAVERHDVRRVGREPRRRVRAARVDHRRRRTIVVGERVARDAAVKVAVVVPALGAEVEDLVVLRVVGLEEALHLVHRVAEPALPSTLRF